MPRGRARRDRRRPPGRRRQGDAHARPARVALQPGRRDDGRRHGGHRRLRVLQARRPAHRRPAAGGGRRAQPRRPAGAAGRRRAGGLADGERAAARGAAGGGRARPTSRATARRRPRPPPAEPAGGGKGGGKEPLAPELAKAAGKGGGTRSRSRPSWRRRPGRRPGRRRLAEGADSGSAPTGPRGNRMPEGEIKLTASKGGGGRRQGRGRPAPAADAPAPAGTVRAEDVDPATLGQEGTGGKPTPEGLALLENKNIVFDDVGVVRHQGGQDRPAHHRRADQAQPGAQDHGLVHVLGPSDADRGRLGLQPLLRPRPGHRRHRRRDRLPVEPARARDRLRALAASIPRSGPTRSAPRSPSTAPATSPTPPT